MPRFSATAAATSALLLASTPAIADGASRQFMAVVCISEGGGPWMLRARGTLTRTKSKSEMAYSFKSSAHTFDWRFIASPQGNTTARTPGYLMERFSPTQKSGERSQSLGSSGEIRESAGPDVLVLRVGSACPR